MATVVALVSQKGGVGKSTLSRALAREAAAGGRQAAWGGKGGGQVDGFCGGTIGDDELGRCGVQQRQDGAAGGAAGAEQQHPFAGDRAAEVDGDVAQDAGTVGVVAEDAVGAESEGVHRAGGLGARRAPGGEAVGVFLERHGDVGASPTLAHETR